MLAIIGGSGMTKLAQLDTRRLQVVRTPFGEPSGPLAFGKIKGRDAVFLARHGYGHTIPPHEVNYRANLWALHSQGATRVVAVASVGGIRRDMAPGKLAVPDQIIDYTSRPGFTFFEGGERPVTHVDFTEPYCEKLRQELLNSAARVGEDVIAGGVYAATQGPRLETAAEINRLEGDGAHMVGMTGMPEAALARELELCYAVLAVVANHAAGKGESAHGIPLERVASVLENAVERVRKVLEQLAAGD